MKAKLLVFMLFYLITTTLFAQNNEYKVNVNLTGISDSLCIYFCQATNPNNIDTDYVYGNDTFKKTYTGSVTEPSSLNIYAFRLENNEFRKYKEIKLFVGNENVSVSGDINDFDIITNSETQQIYNMWVEKLSILTDKMSDVLNRYNRSIGVVSDSITSATILKEYKAYRDKEKQLVSKFISQHPSSETSAFLLHTYMYKIQKDSVKILLDKLDKSCVKTSHGKDLKLFTRTKKLVVGDFWHDFDAFDIEGKEVLFSEIKNIEGKYILLGFSNLGCSPCENSVSELKNVYDIYNDKLELVTYFQGITQEGLKGKAKSHNIDWTYIGLGKYDKETMFTYGAYGTPKFVLISPDRKIIYSWGMGYKKGSLLKKVKEYLE